MSQQIQFPDDVKVEAITLGLEYPGQESLVSIYTGTRQVINRNTGFWAGSMSIFPYENFAGGRISVAVMEAFIANLYGQNNWWQLDLSAIKYGGFLSLSDDTMFGVEVIDDGNGNTTSVASVVKRADQSKIPREDLIGRYLVYADRLRQIVDVLEHNSVEVTSREYDDGTTTAAESGADVQEIVCQPPLPAPVAVGEFNRTPILRMSYRGLDPLTTTRQGDLVNAWVIPFAEHIEP